MKNFLVLFLAAFLFETTVLAQSSAQTSWAIETIQPSQSAVTVPQSTKAPESLQMATKDQAGEKRELKIPAGTTIEVEVAYTVSSIAIRAARTNAGIQERRECGVAGG